MKAFPWVMMAALALSACATGDYQATVSDPPEDALSQTMAECQEQELTPEFDVIRSRISTSVTGVTPAPFMSAAAAAYPPGAEKGAEVYGRADSSFAAVILARPFL